MFIESLVRYLLLSSCVQQGLKLGHMTAFPCPRVGDFDTFDNYFFARGWGS